MRNEKADEVAKEAAREEVPLHDLYSKVRYRNVANRCGNKPETVLYKCTRQDIAQILIWKVKV